MSLVEDVWDMAQTLLEAGAEYDIPTVLGGVFPTAAPEVVLSHPAVKYIAMHEGERTFVDIIKALRAGEDINTVNSIYWQDELGTIHRNPLQPLCDITDVIPDYSLFGEDRYQRPMGGKIWQKAMSMETYRGCPYNCTYCNSPNTRDFSKVNDTGNFLRRKPAHIIDRDFQMVAISTHADNKPQDDF